MKFYKALIYWKDTPEVEFHRFFCHLDDFDNDLERMEGTELDDYIFYYIQEPEELQDLQKHDNGEDFVICPRAVEEVGWREMVR